MSTGFWHWMKYLDGSLSILLHAWDKLWAIKAKNLYNLTIQRKFDNVMKSKFKTKYMDWKEQMATKPAEKALAEHQPQ